ncbi:FadR/GntR family transcriptional regulator [Oceanobacillus sp. CAU 1775]
MSDSPKPKVYQGVLQEIRSYIRNQQLKPGDKLPSERELAEKLQAGRSSVREALRALELLGLIETKHGEGTFLRNYRSLQSVELLSSFILLEDRTKEELIETKLLLEKEGTKLALHHIDENTFNELEKCIDDKKSPEKIHTKFYNILLKNAENQLLFKIWMLMEEFSLAIYKTNYETTFYRKLVEILRNRDFSAIEVIYEKQVQAARED